MLFMVEVNNLTISSALYDFILFDKKKDIKIKKSENFKILAFYTS